jgi:hypothetical protein
MLLLKYLLSVFTVFLHLDQSRASPIKPQDGDPLNYCKPRFLRSMKCYNVPKSMASYGITPSLLERFQQAAKYATASYCENDAQKAMLGNIICSFQNCTLFEGTTGLTQQQNFKSDVGFVAVDHEHRDVVLAFRGTVSRANWVTDFDGQWISTNWCPKCKVHRGFWKTWMQSKPHLTQAVREAVQANPNYTLVITGHSLGGAVATLAAADFRRTFKDLCNETELYTFGSPRVGNVYLVKYLTHLSDKSYRITIPEDPVPKLPPIMLGYLHTSPEYSINAIPRNPEPNSFTVLQGYYNQYGNTGRQLMLCPNAHRFYFGDVTKCAMTPNLLEPEMHQHYQGTKDEAAQGPWKLAAKRIFNLSFDKGTTDNC